MKIISGVPNIYAVGDVNAGALWEVYTNQGISAFYISWAGGFNANTVMKGFPGDIYHTRNSRGPTRMVSEQKGIKYRIENNNLPKLGGNIKGYTGGFIKVLGDDDKLQGIWMVGRDVSEGTSRHFRNKKSILTLS